MTEKLRRLICETVLDASRKMTPAEVERAAVRASGFDRRIVRLAVKDLVSQGQLAYTYVYGTSFLERSFDRPVRISRRIVVKPPDQAYKPAGGEVVIDLARGAAFGDGTHPTTCLVLRALDAIFDAHGCRDAKASSEALDVGTGTGVLAIAMAKLGVQKVTALDTDACAVSEARHNVALNRLEERVRVDNTPMEALDTFFCVIVANLASPTLSGMSRHLCAKMEGRGLLILSGFKAPASEDLEKTYTAQGLRLIREETDRQWVCLVFSKTEFPIISLL